MFRKLRNESGRVEFALIIGLVVVVGIGTVSSLGQKVKCPIGKAGSTVSGSIYDCSAGADLGSPGGGGAQGGQDQIVQGNGEDQYVNDEEIQIGGSDTVADPEVQVVN